MAKFKRKTYLIKKGFQFRYMGVILVALLLVSALVGWTVYFTIWLEIVSDVTGSSSRLVEILNKGNQSLLYKMLFAIIGISFVSVFVSHKIAGPIYRFEESARMIASGDLSLRIRLRKGDEFTDLADAFNAMTESLENTVRKDRVVVSRIKQLLSAMEDDFKKKSLEKKRKDEILEELSSIREDLNMIAHSFVISGDSDSEFD